VSGAARRLAKQMIGRVSPDLLARIQRARARSRYLREPEGGPKRLLLEATTACNHRCLMCGSHSPYSNAPVAARTMPFPRIEGLLREIAAMGAEELWLAGRGEPLVHPQAVEIIRLATSLGLRTQITTNGGRLTEQVLEQLCEAGLSRLSVSIDSGSSATYAQVHQAPAEDRSRILALLRGLSQRTAPRPEVRLSMVVSQPNRAEVQDFLSEAIAVGARVATIAGLRAVPFNASGLILGEQDWAAVRRDLAAVAEAAQRAGLTVLTDHVPAERRAQAPRPPYADMGCFIGHVFSAVDADGDVQGCCSCANHLGSINPAGFAAVWHSRSYRRFRKACREMPVTGLTPSQCDCRACGNVADNLAIQQELQLRFQPRPGTSDFASRLDLAETVWRHFRHLLPPAQPGPGFTDLPADAPRQAAAALLALQGLGLVQGRGLGSGRQVFEPDCIAFGEEGHELLKRVLGLVATPAETAEQIIARAAPPIGAREMLRKQELEAWVAAVRGRLGRPQAR
jgi:MoaA/NifB/PqqE/SkfB family radical SAM enzyme